MNRINIDILKGKTVYFIKSGRAVLKNTRYLFSFLVYDIDYENKHLISDSSTRRPLNFNDYGTKWFLSEDAANKYASDKSIQLVRFF